MTWDRPEEDSQVIRRLRWLTVVLPALFLFVILLTTAAALDRGTNVHATLVAAFGLGTIGVFLFSRTVFLIVERLQERLRRQNVDLARRTRQLEAIHNAGLHVVANLSLPAVLQNVADSSRELVGARYAALAVVQDDEIKQFITAGLTEEERAAIGEPPHGQGLLGHVLRTAKSYRTPDIASDPHSAGFPENHPLMTSFLGIPIVSGEKVIGDLYLTDKEGGAFTEEDEETLGTLAVQAAIAIENARLYEGLEELTRLQERERIAMDLHDGAIQSLYGVSVRLEGAQELAGDSAQIKSDLNAAIDELGKITRRIRNYIFDLQPDELEGRSLPEALSELLRDLSVNALMTTDLGVDSAGDEEEWHDLTRDQTHQLVHIAREALANVMRHSNATLVRAELSLGQGRLMLRIRDNGVGIKSGAGASNGRGLRDMQERATALGGDLLVEPHPEGGTTVAVSLDLAGGRNDA